VARRYSYSDRLRYHWPDSQGRAAEERLLSNLEPLTIPLPLLTQLTRLRRFV
jgi:D-tagatose-1,6-bisphosphate aldolase subunit GatZ/KbaZ